jgi:hypothetical protein
MKVFCKHHELNYFGPCYWRGIVYAQKLLNVNEIPLLGYIKNLLGSITYLKNPIRVLHSLKKT